MWINKQIIKEIFETEVKNSTCVLILYYFMENLQRHFEESEK